MNADFAYLLALFMEWEGVTEHELAHAIAAPTANVRRWLAGLGRPMPEQERRIAEFLELRPRDLEPIP